MARQMRQKRNNCARCQYLLAQKSLPSAADVSEAEKHQILFSTNTIDPDDLAYEVKKFGLVDEIIQIFDATHVVDLKTRPIMPMRHGHLAQALASGIMNGVVRDKNGENPLLVKGLTRKIIDTRREGSGENAKIIETERLKLS